MKRIDGLIFRELAGPWVFGVAIFTALIFATGLLMKITDWVVRGVEPATIMQVVMLLLPGILVKTFAMSLLLAALLGFGRLSNDSEVVALRAAGTSLFRIMRPVFLFSFTVAIVAFVLNETVVPGAASRATALTTEIKKQVDKGGTAKPVFYTVGGQKGPVAQIMAKDFSLLDRTLRGFTLATFDENGHHTYLLIGEELRYFGPKDWRVVGSARLISANGVNIVDIEDGAWPSQIEEPDVSPDNLLAGFADDLDVFSMGQMLEQIAALKKDPNANKRQIANLEFGLYNKIALPLGAVVFALLGAPLGIRNARAGVAVGFALSVVLTFLYMMLANFMAVYSKGGAIPPWVASFTPLAIGLAAACVAIKKKNV